MESSCELFNNLCNKKEKEKEKEKEKNKRNSNTTKS